MSDASETDASETIEIPDRDGGIWGSLLIFGFFECAFGLLTVKYLQGDVDEVMYSAMWWAMLALFATLAAAGAIIIICSILSLFKGGFGQGSLIIDKNGIQLPYQHGIIRWNEVACYYVDDKYRRGNNFQFLHIELKNRRISLNNPFAQKNLAILGRRLRENDDIENCMNLMDRFLATA